MSKYKLNYYLVDTRNNKWCEIVDILQTKGSNLYTVKYNDGQHKRYYENKLLELFVPSQKNEPEYNPDDYKNVYFMDMKNKSKFSDYKSWLAWINNNKVG
jgi:hypothetical protein